MPVPELSPTEERIVLLLAQGRSKSEIAAAVGLDARTVDWHLTQANRKLEKASALLERVRGTGNERKGAVEMRRLRISKRFAGLIAVLVLATGITAASAQTQNRMAHDKAASIELTYTKWFAPGFPNMVGVVGGDIVGQFGGAVLEATPDPTGRFIRLTAIYIVVAPDPSRSLTIRVEGAQDNQSGTAVLDGRVVDGWLTGARVHAEYRVISCTQSSDHTCFQGTISVKRRRTLRRLTAPAHSSRRKP